MVVKNVAGGSRLCERHMFLHAGYYLPNTLVCRQLFHYGRQWCRRRKINSNGVEQALCQYPNNSVHDMMVGTGFPLPSPSDHCGGKLFKLR
jgi:hypothetical protein